MPCDPVDFAWRAFGGYRFSPNLSAEFGYAKLGTAEGSGSTGRFELNTELFDLSGLLSFSLAGDLSAFGRIGGYRARTTVDQEGSFGQIHWAGTNAGWLFGLGLDYPLGFLGLRAEWVRHVNVGTGSTGKDDVDVVSIGVLVRF